FDEYLERKFPESRRKAYYLMAIHEHLPKIAKPDLKLVGWSKATELVKVARRDREQFDCATWLHKATELPKEEFKREVERHLSWQHDSRRVLRSIHEYCEAPEARSRFERISVAAPFGPYARRLALPIVRFTCGLGGSSHHREVSWATMPRKTSSRSVGIVTGK